MTPDRRRDFLIGLGVVIGASLLVVLGLLWLRFWVFYPGAWQP